MFDELALIIQHIDDFDDIVRFSGACRSMRSAAHRAVRVIVSDDPIPVEILVPYTGIEILNAPLLTAMFVDSLLMFACTALRSKLPRLAVRCRDSAALIFKAGWSDIDLVVLEILVSQGDITQELTGNLPHRSNRAKSVYWDSVMRRVAKSGSVAALPVSSWQSALNYCLESGANDWLGAMYQIGKTGSISMAVFLTRAAGTPPHGPRADLRNFRLEMWDACMAGAARNNHRELINHCVANGAASWSRSLIAAAKNGHEDLAKFFLDRSACGPCTAPRTARSAWRAALRGGHEDLANELARRIAPDLQIDLEDVIKRGDAKLVARAMMTTESALRDNIFYAIKHRTIDIIVLLVAALKCIHNVEACNDFMRCAASCGKEDVVSFFVKRGADDWNGGLVAATSGGFWRLVKFFVGRGANSWDAAVDAAICRGCLYLVRFFTKIGKFNYAAAILTAVKKGEDEIAKFLALQRR